MELINRLLGRDEDDGSTSGASDDDEMLFDEGDDGLGGFDEGDDELGGFEDDGLGFDDGDDTKAATAELEGRIDELENEVASLSSTVSTIRSENEEISNTVEDVEENVRKLLDIYEMVTRGVNPFVDDAQAGGGFDGGGGGGSLGLFDDPEDAGEEEDLDEEIAEADAEDFFDEDFLDEGDDAVDDEFDAPEGDSQTETMVDDSDDSGKSFEELKDEYESGDADWADDDAAATNGDAGEFDDDFDEADFDEADFDEADFDEDFSETATAQGDGFGEFDGPDSDVDDPGDAGRDSEAEPATEEAPAEEPAAEEPQPAAAQAATTAAEERAATPDQGAAAGQSGDLQFAANTLMDGSGGGVTKPYLQGVPSGYVGDLLVMEWLEYLVEESDVADAARAIEYYRRIQWVGEDAADELHDFLAGFGEVEADVTGAPSTLSIDHHVASLRYISRLTGSTADSVVFECWSGGGGVPFGL